jgi:hypothetical protein
MYSLTSRATNSRLPKARNSSLVSLNTSAKLRSCVRCQIDRPDLVIQFPEPVVIPVVDGLVPEWPTPEGCLNDARENVGAANTTLLSVILTSSPGTDRAARQHYLKSVVTN